MLRVEAPDVDGYLATLSKATRKDLRRKLRGVSKIETQRTTEPGPWLKTIHALYTGTVDRGELAFGRCRSPSSAACVRKCRARFYELYLVGARLAAFNLLIQGEDAAAGPYLLDKFFGMDPVIGREHDLWFISWLENVRYCIERRIGTYYAGSGSEATKSRLGADLRHGVTLFRHRNPAPNLLLRAGRSFVAYRPDVGVGRVNAGANGVGAEGSDA